MRYVFAILIVFALVACGPDRQNHFEEGRNVALQGIPPEACPHDPSYVTAGSSPHKEWKLGWQKGFIERKNDRSNSSPSDAEVGAAKR